MSANITDNLPVDGSQKPIQIGNSIKTVDASGTPKTSPFTLTGGVDSFTIPAGCVEFIVNPVTHDMKISELSTMARYDTVAQSSKESIPCAKAVTIYVQGTASDVLNFRFTLI